MIVVVLSSYRYFCLVYTSLCLLLGAPIRGKGIHFSGDMASGGKFCICCGLCQSSKIFCGCHHGQAGAFEVFAIAGNNEIGLCPEGGVILHGILEVLEL